MMISEIYANKMQDLISTKFTLITYLNGAFDDLYQIITHIEIVTINFSCIPLEMNTD